MKPKNIILRRCLAYVDSQLEDKPVAPSGNVAPMLLGRICRKWRDIACGTPRLWVTLTTGFWAERLRSNFPLLIREWLRRARAVPFSLTLALPYRHSPSFFLSLPLTNHYTHLVSFHGTCFKFTAAECIDLLARAPRLAHCEFTFRQDLPPSSTPHLLHANLEHLRVSALYIASLLPLLGSITLPGLRSLKIGGQVGAAITFQSFLERAPNLRAFDALLYGSPQSGTPLEVISKALTAMPLVTSLRLVTDPTSISGILHLLKESPTFLPRIQEIKFSTTSDADIRWTDSNVETFIEALTFRWELKVGNCCLHCGAEMSEKYTDPYPF
ncbi:hypothetical protein B0H16DRAFT_1839959 [Mycena metata]|uniref:F-box domain-containing protein n=1 Tax=Mycena metata TaxID=1033252 RepID=A0AAD7IVV0_9AGAR|nr:hypothetical protein B0H16DRAFT_1839959 [Mycena metata]